MKTQKLSRRRFLKGATAAVAAPYVITSTALGQGDVPAASERVALGHIGVGVRGTGLLLNGFLHAPNSRSVAICDPFTDRREGRAARINAHYGEASGKGCAAYRDFRELLARDDIDAVVIATTDHWHVPIGLAAVKAGKDVYIEKPLGLSIEQNQAMRAAVRRYRAIFQYGTHQRSLSPHCAFACELVRNGYLGVIKEVRVDAPGSGPGGSTTPIPVPEGFDYDLWLGPAPVTPYTADRCTNLGSYYNYDNSIGLIAGWGAHPLDIAHWGFPHTPVEYEGTGTIPTTGLFNVLSKWDVRGRYADGTAFHFKDSGDYFGGGGPDNTTFVGEEGTVAASRGAIDAEPKSLLKVKIRPDEIHLLKSNNHYQGFIDSVKSRVDPVSVIESAVQTDIISHLGDIAIRTGRKIQWDPEKEEIVGDAEAARLCSRPMRSPWRL